MDKALRVGDFREIGDRLGTVEDIELRSVELRALNQSLLIIRSGSLAQMQCENTKTRAKRLIDQPFLLRMENQGRTTTVCIGSVQKMLDEHPMIESGISRVPVITFAGAAFELRLFAYGKTGDMRGVHSDSTRGSIQGVLLKIVGIVEAVGTRFAVQPRLTYLHPDPASM
jgi:hypothetical protein